MVLQNWIAPSDNWVLGFGQPERCDRSQETDPATASPIMPFSCFSSASVKGVLRWRLSHYGTTGFSVRCYPDEKDNPDSK
uniref:Uncharacterized protein n=1 Tax=Vespula pensylvanica TaxID=30213 RepID=A0A834P6Y6_VESPE|nr:hypothetical protein H0235_004248 [Vespula pensylvanica]